MGELNIDRQTRTAGFGQCFLLARNGNTRYRHAVMLGGEGGQPAPAAANIKQALAAREFQFRQIICNLSSWACASELAYSQYPHE